jgi:hypothetical protein
VPNNLNRVLFDGKTIEITIFNDCGNNIIEKRIEVIIDVFNDEVVSYKDENYDFGGKKIYECTYAESYLLRQATSEIGFGFVAMDLCLYELCKLLGI